MPTGRPQTFRTERKIEEVAILLHANRSQSVDDFAAAAYGSVMVRATEL